MAKGNIETFTGNVEAPRADQAGSTAYEQLGRHVAASYDAAGNSIAGAARAVGGAYDRHEITVEAADLSKGFADLEVQTAQDLDKAKSTLNPHDTNTVSDFMGAHQETLSNLGANLTTDEGKKLYEQLSNNYRVNTTNKVLGWQSAAAAADTIAKLDGTAKSYANLAQTDPTSAGNYADNIDAMAPSIPTEYRAKVIEAAKQAIYDSAGEGIISKLASNPDATLSEVEAAKSLLADPKNGYIDNMSPGQFAGINNRIAVLEKSIGAVSSEIATQKLSAGIEQVKMNGGVVSPELQSVITNFRGATAAATQEWKALHQQNLDDAAAYGQAAKQVNATPEKDVATGLQSMKDQLKTAPLAQAPALEARIKAATEAQKARNEAFKSDPATWLNQNNDVVKSRYQTFSGNQTAENFQAYAAASIAEQRRLYPNATPNVMPAEMEDTIRGGMKIDLTSKEGPAAAANVLASYARVAGQYWPQMAIKLRQDKVFPAAVGVAAELYGDPKTQALGETLIRAAALTPEERTDKFGVQRDKAIKAANVSLAPLIKTMGNITGGDQVIADYREALVAAYQYMGITSSGDAAAMAQKMVTGRYDIEGGTLRIPKTLGLDASRIGDGAAAVQGDLSNHNIVAPPNYHEMSVSGAYARQLKSTGKWFSNENGTGAILYDEDMHTVKEVINGKKQDVELSWDELGKVADKQPLRATFKAAADTLEGK